MENIITDKKDFKTLKKLCAITYIKTNSFKEVFDMDVIYNITKEHINNGHNSSERINIITIIDIFRKYDISNAEAHKFWFTTLSERNRQHRLYKQKPNKVRQDNKTEINYGTGYNTNRSTIRYPKKCRKTAWKRFNKLFPDLKK